MDLYAWQRQQFIDQLGHNLKRGFSRGESTADILGDTLADCRPFDLDRAAVNATLNEILALGTIAKIYDTASQHQKAMNYLLCDVVGDEHLDHRKDRILELIGA